MSQELNEEIKIIEGAFEPNNLSQREDNNIAQTEELFNEKLNSFPRKKQPYQDILDKYDIKYKKNDSIKILKDLIMKNKNKKNIKL